MEITTVIQLFLAWVIVVYIHELGHFPKKIKFKLFPIPTASAISARSRLGGLVFNVILFYLIWSFKPSLLLFQFVGLIAWLHFIFYLIMGSIVPEPFENKYGAFFDLP